MKNKTVNKKFKGGGYFKSEEIEPGIIVMEMDGKGFVKEFVDERSYTCCNIEVNKKKGSEVMCPECKEWVTTKC